jgi:hypothetical protein
MSYTFYTTFSVCNCILYHLNHQMPTVYPNFDLPQHKIFCPSSSLLYCSVLQRQCMAVSNSMWYYTVQSISFLSFWVERMSRIKDSTPCESTRKEMSFVESNGLFCALFSRDQVVCRDVSSCKSLLILSENNVCKDKDDVSIWQI